MATFSFLTTITYQWKPGVLHIESCGMGGNPVYLHGQKKGGRPERDGIVGTGIKTLAGATAGGDRKQLKPLVHRVSLPDCDLTAGLRSERKQRALWRCAPPCHLGSPEDDFDSEPLTQGEETGRDLTDNTGHGLLGQISQIPFKKQLRIFPSVSNSV